MRTKKRQARVRNNVLMQEVDLGVQKVDLEEEGTQIPLQVDATISKSLDTHHLNVLKIKDPHQAVVKGVRREYNWSKRKEMKVSNLMAR